MIKNSSDVDIVIRSTVYVNSPSAVTRKCFAPWHRRNHCHGNIDNTGALLAAVETPIYFRFISPGIDTVAQHASVLVAMMSCDSWPWIMIRTWQFARNINKHLYGHCMECFMRCGSSQTAYYRGLVKKLLIYEGCWHAAETSHYDDTVNYDWKLITLCKSSYSSLDDNWNYGVALRLRSKVLAYDDARTPSGGRHSYTRVRWTITLESMGD